MSSVRVSIGAHFLVAVGADPEILDTLRIQPPIVHNLPGSGNKLTNPSVLISHACGSMRSVAPTGDRTVAGHGRISAQGSPSKLWFTD